MHALDTWDWVLLAIAGFVAITTLLKLMQAHRDDVLKKLRREFEAEQLRLRAEERKQKKKEARQKAA